MRRRPGSHYPSKSAKRAQCGVTNGSMERRGERSTRRRLTNMSGSRHCCIRPRRPNPRRADFPWPFFSCVHEVPETARAVPTTNEPPAEHTIEAEQAPAKIVLERSWRRRRLRLPLTPMSRRCNRICVLLQRPHDHHRDVMLGWSSALVNVRGPGQVSMNLADGCHTAGAFVDTTNR
jgi:hypothetical protein